MVRPERPSRLYSTYPDARPAGSGPGARSRRQTSGLKATSGLGDRQRRIMVERLMPYQARPRIRTFVSGKRSVTARRILRASTNESTTTRRKKPNHAANMYDRTATLG